MTDSTTSLPDLSERIRGFLYGCAVGDAFGLGTFHMTPVEVKRHHPKGLTDYSQFINDTVRTLFEPGSWGSDTAQAICAARTLGTTGKADFRNLAMNLQEWYTNERLFVSTQLRGVLANPDYVHAPFATAIDVWHRMGACEASNQCLSRVLPFAMAPGDVHRHSTEACRLTHPSPICIGCAEAIGYAGSVIFTEHRIPRFEEVAENIHTAHEEVEPYLRLAESNDLAALELYDEDSYFFVRKTTASALWAVWHAGSFEQGLTQVVLQGGDAPTNGALAGSLMGLYYGFSSIPDRWLSGLLNRDPIDEAAELMLKMIRRISPEIARRADGEG